MYENILKRVFDFTFSLIAIILLFPLLITLSLVGAIVMKGNPFFVQKRPGKIDANIGKEVIFKLIKFRTMSNEKDEYGDLLPDKFRLNGYGKFLRSTSLDELPSLINIIRGDLAIVGPRPQLVRDMVFMTDIQRKRHTVRPGLTGLAQINGRNNIDWENKFEYDLLYLKEINFLNDLKIVLKTVSKVLRRSDVIREGTNSDMDFGDWLLLNNKISKELYDKRQVEAKRILNM